MDDDENTLMYYHELADVPGSGRIYTAAIGLDSLVDLRFPEDEHIIYFLARIEPADV